MASAYSPEGTAVATIFFLVTVWVSTVLRIYVRLQYGKGPFLDDLLAVIAACMFTVYAVVFVYYQINNLIPLSIPNAPEPGHAPEPPALSPSRIALTHRLLFICDELYTVETYIMKLSFTCMLLRLAQTRRQFIVLAVTMISGAILTTASIIHDLLFCEPISYQWTRFADPNAEGHCHAFWARAVITLIHGSWVMLADITLGLVVPLMLLWDIRMHPRTKLSIRFLLGLGSLASIATIIRLAYLGLATDPSVTWAIIPMAFWSIVEQGVSITCIAAATLKPLFVRIGIVDPRDQSPIQLLTCDVFGGPDEESGTGGGVVMEDARSNRSSQGSGASGGGASASAGSAEWGEGDGDVGLLPPKTIWRDREKKGGDTAGAGGRKPMKRADSGVGEVRTEVQIFRSSSSD